MKSYFEIDKLGHLNIDTVIFESYYPILFTCMNEKKDLFLCVCCQSNKEGRKWLITKTTPDVIIRVLKNELTIREAFLMFPQVQFTVFDNNQEVISYEKLESDWDNDTSISLPDKDEFLDAEDGEFDNEIQYFESLLCDDYNAVFSEKTFNLSNEQIKQNKILIDKLNSSNIYCNAAIIKETEIYNHVKKVSIKEESLKKIFEQYKSICISYCEEYREVEKKFSKEGFLNRNCMEVEKCIKEISEAA